jgi:hypothetical protein
MTACHGKPRTQDTRHDFRDWCQVMDWIVQNVFGLAPLMNGHQSAQERVSNPALGFLRALALAVEAEGKLDEPLTAGDLVEVCQAHDIQLPHLRPGVDDKTARQVAGRVLGRLFKGGARIEREGYVVTKGQKEYLAPGGDWLEANTYTFTKA